MLGAWLFADNSSRAPGAPWGGAVGMPSLRVARHGDEGACGTARRSRASRQGGRAAVSGSACGCSPHSLAPAGKRSWAGCGGSEGCGRGAGRFGGAATVPESEAEEPLPATSSPAAAAPSPRYALGSFCCGSRGAAGSRPARSACLRVAGTEQQLGGESGCIRDGLFFPGMTISPLMTKGSVPPLTYCLSASSSV